MPHTTILLDTAIEDGTAAAHASVAWKLFDGSEKERKHILNAFIQRRYNNIFREHFLRTQHRYPTPKECNRAYNRDWEIKNGKDNNIPRIEPNLHWGHGGATQKPDYEWREDALTDEQGASGREV